MSRLEEIAARAAAATPGPWGAWIEGLRHPFHPEITAWGGSSIVYTTTGTAIADELDRDADAAFIAAARDDVPFLLAEVERLRARLEQMRTYARHDPFCNYRPTYPDAPVATCDCGFDAVLEKAP